MMKRMGWMGMAAMVVAGCDSSTAPGTTGAPLSVAQLAERLDLGAARVELRLREGERELKLEGAEGEERLQGLVLDFDLEAGTLELADLGEVGFGGGTRFRTLRDSNVSLEDFAAEIEAGLASGAPVYARATRPTASEPSAPEGEPFIAADLRLEEKADTKLELAIDADNFVASPPTLRVLGRSHDLSTATMSDDDPADHDLFDDHGGSGTEPGDDNGGSGSEPGDDNGGSGSEPGDDNGVDG